MRGGHAWQQRTRLRGDAEPRPPTPTLACTAKPRTSGSRTGTHDAQAPWVPRAARGRGRARRGALLSRGMITEEILEPTARGL